MSRDQKGNSWLFAKWRQKSPRQQRNDSFENMMDGVVFGCVD